MDSPGFSAFLLAMQAAGIVIDINNTKQQKKLIDVGRQVEQSAFETNLSVLEAQSAEQSLESMRQLRKTIGSQIALSAARGTASGAGSAFFATQESIRNFNADERARRLNLLARQSNLRQQNIASGLQTLQSETRLGQSLTKRIFDTLPISAGFELLKRGSGSLQKTFGFGLDPAENS